MSSSTKIAVTTSLSFVTRTRTGQHEDALFRRMRVGMPPSLTSEATDELDRSMRLHLALSSRQALDRNSLWEEIIPSMICYYTESVRVAKQYGVSGPAPAQESSAEREHDGGGSGGGGHLHRR